MPLLVLLILSAPLFAQQGRQTLIRESDRKVSPDRVHLSAAASVLPLTVDMTKFRTVATSQLRLASVPVSPGIQVDLDLEEFSVLTPDATLSSSDETGTHPVAGTTTRLYRGRVAGDKGGTAFLAFSDNQIAGSVVVGGKTYKIATDHHSPNRDGSLGAIAYSYADVIAPMSCGLNDDNEHILGRSPTKEEIARALEPSLLNIPITVQFATRGAFDGDYEYYRLFDPTDTIPDARQLQDAVDYMVMVVGQVSDIYERDMNTQVAIGYLNIWTTANDPYAETGSMQLGLFEARQFWQQQRGSVQRSFAHIFSGKGWTNPIGIAFVNVLCDQNAAMAYSYITKYGNEQDVNVVAHENGHIFGSPHTHSCGWAPAIDSCAAAENGSCFGAADVKEVVGTIMSYCGAKEQRFEIKTATLIRNNVVAAGEPCVIAGRKVTVQPVLTSLPKVSVNTNRDSTILGFWANPSVSTVRIDSLTITGVNSERFTVLEPSFPFDLAAGDTQYIRVRFNSPVQEPSYGTFTSYHTGYNPKQTVYFEAYAEDLYPLLGMRLSVSRDIDFGTIKLGEERDTTIKNFFFNARTAVLHIAGTRIFGPDQFDFQMIEGTGDIDIPSGNISVPARFTFKPQSRGEKIAYVEVQSNARGHELDTFTLRGNVKQGPLVRLGINDLTINFGERQKRKVYDTAFTQFFYNAGSDSVILVFDVEGEDKNAFNEPFGNLIRELAPGEQSDLRLQLFDTTDGIKNAFMVINHQFGNYEDLNITYRRDTVWLLAFVGQWASTPGEDLGNAGIVIAPNPTSGDPTITLSPLPGEQGQEFTLTLIDGIGREVYRSSDKFAATETSFKLETGTLPAGVYHLIVNSNRGKRLERLTIR